MSQLELRDIPEQLFVKLQDRAAEHGRSIEDEAIECIAEAVGTDEKKKPRRRPTLEEIAGFRASLGDIYITEEEIQAAKRKGRP
jgi:plasmid stability protein